MRFGYSKLDYQLSTHIGNKNNTIADGISETEYYQTIGWRLITSRIFRNMQLSLILHSSWSWKTKTIVEG